MKYVVVLGDGMADWPLPMLDGRTPLQAANTPHMDFLAKHGEVGLVRTVPEGMPPGSDTANLAVLGYAPEKYYSGRSPLEAISLGIDLRPDDVCFRCNLVSLSNEPAYADKTMLDYAAGEIPSDQSHQIIADLARLLDTQKLHLYPGISYRHCLVLNQAQTGTILCPPHDITGQPIHDHLPQGRYGELLYTLMRRSAQILQNHPVNQSRRANGLRTADSVWFWGEGTRPRLDPLRQLYGVNGGMICGVDLLRGIGVCAGLRTIPVEGATGGMTTNYRGKALAALKLLKTDCDFVYIHIEAPDECGHQGDMSAKIAAIEAIDREVIALLLDELDQQKEAYSLLLTADHPTPLAIRTHTADPVPYVIYRSQRDSGPHAPSYCEQAAAATGLFLPAGPMLMQRLTGKYQCDYFYEENPQF